MENLNVNVSVKDLTEMVKDTLGESIKKSLAINKQQIEKSIDDFFKKGFFSGKETQFESALDWAIESAFREGLSKAMEEVDLKELIAQKAKEILLSDDFIKDLAIKKVRASLGLTNI